MTYESALLVLRAGDETCIGTKALLLVVERQNAVLEQLSQNVMEQAERISELREVVDAMGTKRPYRGDSVTILRHQREQRERGGKA